MCCLFGLIDYEKRLTGKEKNRMLALLSQACEVRGTDATGIAYNLDGTLHIYKRPVPAHCLHVRVPEQARVIMGHTRMATQGSARQNYNNHPFQGTAGKDGFALAHNGVLHNDLLLRSALHLPKTKIRTDSYIAVQLLQQKNALNFDSLRYMAEQVEGSFTFTVLDRRNRLYIIKGDNPLCLLRFPTLGLVLYASTEKILMRAISRMGLDKEHAVRIPVDCGEILRIDKNGAFTRSYFDDFHLFTRWQPSPVWESWETSCTSQAYLDSIKSVSSAFGYAPEEIDRLAEEGFSPEELEAFLYCGRL